jgi:predicted anti-sigma-YlaC factor YlaD
MTTRNHSLFCEEVQMAAMARLDGEAPALTPEQVDAHIAGCDACQDALANLTTLYARLNRVDYDHLDMDLWPMIHQRVASSTPR